jgi:hypothetical protein
MITFPVGAHVVDELRATTQILERIAFQLAHGHRELFVQRLDRRRGQFTKMKPPQVSR